MLTPIHGWVVGSGSIDSGLVGYWRFDEGSGTSAFDSSIGINTGTLSGSPLPSWVSGEFDKAMNFIKGDSQFVSVANYGLLNGASAFSGSIWIKSSGLSGSTNYVFRIRNSSDFDILSMVAKGTSNAVSVYATTKYLAQANVGNSTLWSLNAWVNLAFVYNGTGLSLYKNGVYVKSTALTGVLVSTATQFYIGNYGSNSLGLGFNGTIDNFRLYNRALSASEVSTLYNGYPISVTSDLGSLVSPNGTVLVGVDQNKTFSVGAKAGYSPWTSWIDDIAYAPNALVNFVTIENSHSLYVTSQYIGSVSSSSTSNPSIWTISLLVYFILVAWLVFSAFISFKYWDLFGVFAALAPGILLTLLIIGNRSTITGSTYDSALIWIPIMLLILNVAIPIQKHL